MVSKSQFSSNNQRGRIEEIEQSRLVKWSHFREVRALMPALQYLFHVPNGGQRSAFTGAQMKALGVKPGVPDLLLPIQSGYYHGLAIEFKTSTGKTSAEQVDWLGMLESQAWRIAIARSAEEGRSLICQYLGIPEANAPALDRS